MIDDDIWTHLSRSSTLEVIENSGHDPTFEQPDVLASAIARAVVRLA